MQLFLYATITKNILSFLQSEVQKIITFAWDIFKPLLFALVGLEVSVEALQSDAIGKNDYSTKNMS